MDFLPILIVDLEKTFVTFIAQKGEEEYAYFEKFIAAQVRELRKKGNTFERDTAWYRLHRKL
jgi:hypothetical protein